MALLVRVDLLLLLVPGSGPLGHRAGCALGGRWGRLAGAVANARCGRYRAVEFGRSFNPPAVEWVHGRGDASSTWTA